MSKSIGKSTSCSLVEVTEEQKNVVILPDSFKLAVNIEQITRELTMSVRLKDYIIRMTKELQNMFMSYSELAPYFRRELTQLRVALKHIDETGDDPVREKADILKMRIDKVRSRRDSLIRRANETVEQRQKMFFACIDEGVRIAVTEKQINIAAKMNEAKNLKLQIQLIQKALNGSNVTPKTKKALLELTNEIIRMFAIDGLTAMKLRVDIADVKDMVSRGKQAEGDLEVKLKLLKVKVAKLSKEAAQKRDETEKALTDVHRTMLYLDKKAEKYRSPKDKDRAEKPPI